MGFVILGMGLEFLAASVLGMSGLVCKGSAAAEISPRGTAGTAGRWQPRFTCACRPGADRPGLLVRAGGQGPVCHRRCLRHGARSPQHAQEPLPWQGGAVPQDGPGGRRGAAQVHPQRQLLRSVRPQAGGLGVPGSPFLCSTHNLLIMKWGMIPCSTRCTAKAGRKDGVVLFTADQQMRRSKLPRLLGAFGE